MSKDIKAVVVTGAGAGIGRAIAIRMAKEGYAVAVVDVDADRADRVAQEIRMESGSAEAITCDVGDKAQVFHMVEKAAQVVGEIDLLINNAGIYGGERQSFGDIDYAQWARVLEVNTLGPYRVSTALANQVGNSEQRLMVNVSSAMGSIERYTTGGHYIYRSSKAALNMVTVNLAHDLRSRGITVLSVHPGWVRTDMGGSSADISTQTSAAGLRQLISNATIEDSGRFFSWDGSALPW